MKNVILFFLLILTMGMIHGCNNATRDPDGGMIVTEQVSQKAKQDSINEVKAMQHATDSALHDWVRQDSIDIRMQDGPNCDTCDYRKAIQQAIDAADYRDSLDKIRKRKSGQ